MTAVASLRNTSATESIAIRPFRFTASQAALDDLRRRIGATQWPDRETVTDQSQGPQLATMQKLARYWATEYDWRKVEARLNGAAEFRHRDRWARHPLHSRSFEARERAAAHRHARLARFGDRAVEDHRSAHQPDGPWRQRGRRIRPGDPVDAGLRIFGQAGPTGWDPAHIARAWVVLMKRLGYTKFVAQGGDWGAIVTEHNGLHRGIRNCSAFIPTCRHVSTRH